MWCAENFILQGRPSDTSIVKLWYNEVGKIDILFHCNKIQPVSFAKCSCQLMCFWHRAAKNILIIRHYGNAEFNKAAEKFYGTRERADIFMPWCHVNEILFTASIRHAENRKNTKWSFRARSAAKACQHSLGWRPISCHGTEQLSSTVQWMEIQNPSYTAKTKASLSNHV